MQDSHTPTLGDQAAGIAEAALASLGKTQILREIRELATAEAGMFLAGSSSMLGTQIPPELVRRYDSAGPRYTSYPTAPEWRDSFGPKDLEQRITQAAALPSEPLSLYVHLPFCQEMCSYCGCNVVIAKDRGKADTYLDHLEKELALVAGHLGQRRCLSQLHLGGGTPTFLTEAQLLRLNQAIRRHFEILKHAEVAIEIDPVVTTEEQLHLLSQLGWNRLSMGVQDFDPKVQEAVCRIQSVEQTTNLLTLARKLGFSGINFDLIYGLPYQTLATFERTLVEVLRQRPDRLAIYSMAYVPELRPHQKRLPVEAMLQGEDKLALLLLAHQLLCEAGYVPIGMDHFALPEDELAQAQARRSLWRNFQGYTVKSALDSVGVGITAISDIQGAYAQSLRPLPAYYRAISQGELATCKGLVLSEDDQRRRAIITDLMCNFYVDLGDAEIYQGELAALAPMEADGLVEVSGARVQVTQLGRFFVRNVAMVFDTYLRSKEGAGVRYSRTV